MNAATRTMPGVEMLEKKTLLSNVSVWTAKNEYYHIPGRIKSIDNPRCIYDSSELLLLISTAELWVQSVLYNQHIIII